MEDLLVDSAAATEAPLLFGGVRAVRSFLQDLLTGVGKAFVLYKGIRHFLQERRRPSSEHPGAGSVYGPRAGTKWTSFASHDHTAFPSPGYYTQISTLADAQENVMEYLHVLSRPMVINHDHDIIWTEAYMDSRVSMVMAPEGQGGPELMEGAVLVQRGQYCASVGGIMKDDDSHLLRALSPPPAPLRAQLPQRPRALPITSPLGTPPPRSFLLCIARFIVPSPLPWKKMFTQVNTLRRPFCAFVLVLPAFPGPEEAMSYL